MNSTEHLDHGALTNNSLLFPSLLKHAWAIFKKKWGVLFSLALIPVIFIVSACTILISTVYIVMKLAGESDFIVTAFTVFRFAPQYISVVGSLSGAVIILGTIYFSLRSTVASVKVLESDAKITIRHAWHGISFKTVGSLLAVIILLGIILASGYVLLFVPFLFLLTFYSNAVFTNIIEGKKGIDALVLSRQYVKGYGAIVFVNLLVVFGIGMLFGLLFKLSLGIGPLLALAVYFGKISILMAIVITLLAVVVALLILVLWKAFSFVVLYSMFKKLQSLKAHQVTNLNEDRKTVKIWLILSIITIAIFIGVTSALDHNSKQRSAVDDYSADMNY